MNWSLDKEKSRYIFRYYVPYAPTYDEEVFKRRGDELIDYCLKNGIDTVMLYVDLNPNWYYMPDSLERQKQYAMLMKELIPKLRENEISYHLNYQNLFGMWDGGADLTNVNNWECWVDEKGLVSMGCACSIGKRFREIAGEKLSLWSQTNPDVIWIDDDIRFHNHRAPVREFWQGITHYERTDYGCFCDEHIKLFNKKNNSSYTRSQIRDGIINGGELRGKWLEFSRECADEVTLWIEKTIHNVSPDTRVAVMTSLPDVHSVEGRNWNSFLSNLSGGNKPLIRPTFGPYSENSPVDFCASYLLVDQLKANIKCQYGENVDFCPEIENTRFSVWSKSIAATKFQMMMSAFHGCKGLTLSIFDLEGCILNEEPEFGTMLIDMKPFLDEIAKLKLWNYESEGVALITAPDRIANSKRRVCEIDDLAFGRLWDTALIKAGIPVKYITPAEISDESVIAIDSYSANLLSEEEIQALLSKGVIMDAGAARILCERGFGGYLGVSLKGKMECIAASEVFHSLTRSDSTPVRVTSRISGYQWSDMELTGAQKLSSLLTPYGSEHVGFSKFENSLGGKIYIYASDGGLGDGFYTSYRVKFLKSICNEASGNKLVDVNNSSYSITASKTNGENRVVFISNLRADVMKDVVITLPQNPTVATFINSDGKVVSADIAGNTVVCKNANLGIYDAIVCVIQM